jgi:hypothetical protein
VQHDSRLWVWKSDLGCRKSRGESSDFRGRFCDGIKRGLPRAESLLDGQNCEFRQQTHVSCLAGVLHVRETMSAKSQSRLLRDDSWMHRNVSIDEAHMRPDRGAMSGGLPWIDRLWVGNQATDGSCVSYPLLSRHSGYVLTCSKENLHGY